MKSPVRVRAKGDGAARGAVCLSRKAAGGAPVDGGSRRTTSGFRHRLFLTSPASVRPRGKARSAWHHGVPGVIRIASGRSAGEAEAPQSSHLGALLASRFQSRKRDRRRSPCSRHDVVRNRGQTTVISTKSRLTFYPSRMRRRGPANNAFSSRLVSASQVSHARAATGLDQAACETSRWWRRRGVRASTLAGRSCRTNQD